MNWASHFVFYRSLELEGNHWWLVRAKAKIGSKRIVQFMHFHLVVGISQYLDFAERQARHRKMMYMTDWKIKLDAFLQLNDGKILTHAGKISAEMAKELTLSEHAKFVEHRKAEEIMHAEEELQETLSKVMANRESSESDEV